MHFDRTTIARKTFEQLKEEPAESKNLTPFFNGVFYLMSHFVYIIYSESFDVYYKGETSNIEVRLSFHNNDLSRYTKGKGPLVYLQEFPNRIEALKKEKMLKKQNRK